jgi:hypothetical protein
MVVACSEIALYLVENKRDLRVVRVTFEALSGSLIVMDRLVVSDWYRVKSDLVYRLVLGTFVNGLMIDCIPSCDGSGWMGPKLGPFPAGNILDVVCISHLHLCTALNYTTSCVSSRTGRTSIRTSNYQHVDSVRRLVALERILGKTSVTHCNANLFKLHFCL